MLEGREGQPGLSARLRRLVPDHPGQKDENRHSGKQPGNGRDQHHEEKERLRECGPAGHNGRAGHPALLGKAKPAGQLSSHPGGHRKAEEQKRFWNQELPPPGADEGST